MNNWIKILIFFWISVATAYWTHNAERPMLPAVLFTLSAFGFLFYLLTELINPKS